MDPGRSPASLSRRAGRSRWRLDGGVRVEYTGTPLPVEEALAQLRELPGIGPFSAELVLIRGAGHPDVFPRHERRLHAAMATEYGGPADDVTRLARIAEGWRPYRSWVGLLLRTRAAEGWRVPGSRRP